MARGLVHRVQPDVATAATGSPKAARHEWFRPDENGYPNLGPWESCRKCGIVKNDKNADAETCRGVVKVGLRTAQPPGPPVGVVRVQEIRAFWRGRAHHVSDLNAQTSHRHAMRDIPDLLAELDHRTAMTEARYRWVCELLDEVASFKARLGETG